MTNIQTKEKRDKVLGFFYIAIVCIFGAAVIWFFVTAFNVHNSARNTAADPNPSEYVGVWALYKSNVDGKDVLTFDDVKDSSEYICLYENGEADYVISLGDKADAIDCKWSGKTSGKEYGDDAGVILANSDFRNPFKFISYSSDQKPSFVKEPLAGGYLVIDYGSRVVNFEKVSNNPDDKPWLQNTDNSNKSSSVSSSKKSTSSKPKGAISFNEAKNHIDEEVTVYGTVVDAEYASSSSGEPTFLDIGAKYPSKKRLSIVIWGEDRDKFSKAPEKKYEGKKILVTGVPYIYDGVCNIEVSSPSQIEIL